MADYIVPPAIGGATYSEVFNGSGTLLQIHVFSGSYTATFNSAGDVYGSLVDEVVADSPESLWICDDGSGSPTDHVGSDDLVLNAGSNVYLVDSRFGSVIDSSVGDWKFSTHVNQTEYTLEAWIYLDSTPSGESSPISDWGGALAEGVMFVFVSGVVRAYHAANFLSGGSLATTAWHYLAVTWDGATQRFYVDGTELDNRAEVSAPGTSNGPGAFPRVSNYGAGDVTRRVPGREAYLAIYDHALTAGRVLIHWEAGQQEIPPAPLTVEPAHIGVHAGTASIPSGLDSAWVTTVTAYYDVALRLRPAAAYASNPGGQHPTGGHVEQPAAVTPFEPDVNPLPPDPSEIEVPLPPWIPSAGTWRED